MNTKYSYSELEVCYLPNGSKYGIPVHTFEGKGDKVVGIGCCLHGDEIVTVEVGRRLIEFLKTQEVHGTVKVSPCVHTLAFEVEGRNNPLDGLNLNRVFPGRADGFLTERIAYTYFEEYVTKLDAFIDVHAGGDALPLVNYCYIINDEAMSRAFGSDCLYRPSSDYPGNVNSFARDRGVRCMVAECGGLMVREADVQRCVEGCISVLRHEGMIDGEEIRRNDQVVCDYIAHIDPHQGGLMVPCLKEEDLGTIVEGKVPLAKIYNPKTTELLETLYAPFERNYMILLRSNANRAMPGDFSFMIADADAFEK